MKLIIVDDEPWATVLIQKIIPWGEHGFQVRKIVNQGIIALQICKAEHIDLVITDVRMPEYDGLDLCRDLLTLTNPPEIILISGHSDFVYAQKALRFGVVDYILKPLDPTDIQKSVVKAVSRIQSRKTILNKVNNLERTIKKLSVDYKQMITGLNVNSNINDSRILRALDFIHENPDSNLSLELLAEKVFLTPQHLSVLFKNQVGVLFSEYLSNLRITLAKAALQNQLLSIKEISGLCGFQDADYFCRFFKKNVGLTPSQFRRTLT